MHLVTLLRHIHNMVPFSKYRNCCENAFLDKESQYWVVKSVFQASRAVEFISSENVVGSIFRLVPLVDKASATHITTGNDYFITSRKSYSCDYACSRKDFTTQTSVFFSVAII